MNHVHSLPPLSLAPLRAAEFFAGIGLVRAGLEPAGFEIVWANDFEPAKKEMYEGNFGTDHDFALGDVAEVNSSHLPEDLDLAWASFPCTDLSLAGDRRGLAGKQSGTFFHFTRILAELGDKKPRVIALENVNGLATSHGGDDMAALVRELNGLGYSVDVMALDGRRFVAQSRPRIFVVGSMDVPEEDTEEVSTLRPEWLQGVFQDDTLVTHRAALPEPPAMMTVGLADVIEAMGPRDSRWWEAERKKRFLDSLSPVQRGRLEAMKSSELVTYRTAYRRTRAGVPVWEIRADEISGCLRTARGGSSKQAVVMAGQGRIAVRWMTPLEYARLMGAPEYNLKGLRDSQILFGFGDAVVVPAVQWVGDNYLAPLIRGELAQPALLERVAG
ncbi:DNA (cytosine-5-)-methyltransferase [Pseudarthrobacter oxydans]|uniref:DNA cytosine methyltransferase n=1 Tax=Pseudarthrobacter oxydans TaxID=1671 RepID=UPI001572EE23|nr:DNA (cytosine-5-)-methyltransferase [Pseudarthrobacter oxydans]NSX38305.1 DNA (cytosine-5-)-methyltransferase [Pseudarthrobacter oxydans]